MQLVNGGAASQIAGMLEGCTLCSLCYEPVPSILSLWQVLALMLEYDEPES